MAMQFDKYVRSAYYRLKAKNTALPCILSFLLSNQTATKISRKTNFPYPIYIYYTATLLCGFIFYNIYTILKPSFHIVSSSIFIFFILEPTEQTRNAGDPKSFLLRIILLWGLFHLDFGFVLKGWQTSCKF